MFGWDFEVDAWSKIWRGNLIKICVWTCDMTKRSYFGNQNSTLGSVVPLAMFHLSFLQKNLLFVTHLTVCRCEPCHLVMIVFVLPPYITFGKVSANITAKHDKAVSYSYDKQVIQQFFPQQCQSFEDVFQFCYLRWTKQMVMMWNIGWAEAWSIPLGSA